MTPGDLVLVEILAERAKNAETALRAARAQVEELRQARDTAVNELHHAGWSQRRIASHLGLSPARAAQLTAPNGANPGVR